MICFCIKHNVTNCALLPQSSPTPLAQRTHIIVSSLAHHAVTRSFRFPHHRRPNHPPPTLHVPSAIISISSFDRCDTPSLHHPIIFTMHRITRIAIIYSLSSYLHTIAHQVSRRERV